MGRQWVAKYVDALSRKTNDRQRGIKPHLPLKAAVEEYLKHRESTVERNTYLNDVSATGHLLDKFGEKRDVHAITQEQIQAWFNERAGSYRPGTLALYAVHLRTFFRQAGRPIEKIQLRESHKQDPDALTDDELDAVFGAIKTDRENVVLRVGLGTGARKGELWALEWSDFRPDMRSVRIARQIAWPDTGVKGLKGKRNRTALVLPGFLDDLPRGSGRVVPGWVTHTENAGDVVKRVLKRAGVWKMGRGSHILRHTYSRLGLEKYGWSIEMLRIFLGHASIMTTSVYAHFGEEVAVKLAMQRTYREGK